MEERPSIQSSNSLPILCLLSLLACMGALSDTIPMSWLHPNSRLQVTNPSFIYICSSILLCTYFKHNTLPAFMVGALGLAFINLPLPLTERLLNLGYYTICFSFIAYWIFLKLPVPILFILLCLDVGIAFQVKVFFDETNLPLTPLSWQFQTHPEHFFCLFVLPCLAFGYRKLRPAVDELR